MYQRLAASLVAFSELVAPPSSAEMDVSLSGSFGRVRVSEWKEAQSLALSHLASLIGTHQRQSNSSGSRERDEDTRRMEEFVDNALSSYRVSVSSPEFGEEGARAFESSFLALLRIPKERLRILFTLMNRYVDDGKVEHAERDVRDLSGKELRESGDYFFRGYSEFFEATSRLSDPQYKRFAQYIVGFAKNVRVYMNAQPLNTDPPEKDKGAKRQEELLTIFETLANKVPGVLEKKTR